VPGGITVPPFLLGELVLKLVVATRLRNLLCKRIIVAKPKEVKTVSNLTEFSKDGYSSKSAVLPMKIIIVAYLCLINIIRYEYSVYVEFELVRIFI
jgi:hypothetical protein